MANQVTEAKKVKLQPFETVVSRQFAALDNIDVATWEEKVGLLLSGKYLARATGWDNFVFCAYLAQRKRLGDAGVTADMVGMLGKPGSQYVLRQVLLVHWATTNHVKEHVMRCRVPADSKALAPFAKFLNEAIAQIVKEEYVGQGAPSIPKYSAIGVGNDIEGPDGHSPKLKALLQQRLTAAKATKAS